MTPGFLCSRSHFQIVGGLLLSSLRPDCLMHPYLRCHVECYCGGLLAFEMMFGRLESTRVRELALDMCRDHEVFRRPHVGWLGRAAIRSR